MVAVRTRVCSRSALLFAVPLAWGAYELRYGSAQPVIILFGTTAVLFWPTVSTHFRLVGRVLYTSQIAGRDYLGQGPIDYLTDSCRTRGTSRCGSDEHRAGRAGAPMGPGPDATRFAVRRARGRRSRTSATLLLLLLLVLLAVGTVSYAAPADIERRRRPATLAKRKRILVEASRSLRTSSGDDCSALTGYSPQATWYSGCASYGFGSEPTTGREELLTDDAWTLLFEDGKSQPDEDTLQYYLSGRHWYATVDCPREGQLGAAELHRLDGTAERG